MEFTVKRGLWLHGEGSHTSYLLREKDGKMCCLGFGALSCGMSETDIKGVSTPSNAVRYNAAHLVGWIAELVNDENDCTDLCAKIMDVNDTALGREIANYGSLQSDMQREELLAELFLKLDVEVIFED